MTISPRKALRRIEFDTRPGAHRAWSARPNVQALQDARRILTSQQRSRIRKAFFVIWDTPYLPDRVGAINALFTRYAEHYGISEAVARAAVQTNQTAKEFL